MAWTAGVTGAAAAAVSTTGSVATALCSLGDNGGGGGNSFGLDVNVLTLVGMPVGDLEHFRGAFHGDVLDIVLAS